jgi:tRNA-modifying protein YgfZ
VSPRHFGDPRGEYLAATESGAALVDRSSRTRLRIVGRAPAAMLKGLVTGSIPSDPVPMATGILAGEASNSLILTPKGRIVTDLRLLRLEGGEAGSFLLELPAAGCEPLLDHLSRYLPPRMARPEDVSAETSMLTLVGPAAAGLLESVCPDAATLLPGALRLDPSTSLIVVRTDSVWPPAFDLLGPTEVVHPLGDTLRGAGAVLAGDSVWETLRVEGGRPEMGRELDAEILPPEAGLENRAIDHTKGCYTGQEVIVRIRDRGHVNRHLRGLLLGDAPAFPPGTELFSAEGRGVGVLRSSVQSPRFGQGIALAYLRREVAPGDTVRLGGAEGPEVIVRALGPTGWVEDTEDPLIL